MLLLLFTIYTTIVHAQQYVYEDDSIKITWNVVDETTLEVIVERTCDCWLGIGISDELDDLMYGDVVVGNYAKSVVEVYDMTSRDPTKVDSVGLLKEHSYTTNNGTSRLSFTTSKIHEKDVFPGKKQWIAAWGFSEASFGFHEKAIVIPDFSLEPPPTNSNGTYEVQVSDDMTVVLSSKDSTSVDVSAKATGLHTWVSVGISDGASESKMIGNAVIGMPESNSGYDIIAEYVITGQSITLINKYDQQINLEDPVYKFENGDSILTFTASKIGDRSFNLEDSDFLIFAHGTGENFVQHAGRNRLVTLVDWGFLQGENVSAGTPPEFSTPNLILAHGSLMLITWLVSFPIGVLFAALFNASPKTVGSKWLFRFHRVIQIGSFLFFLVGFICIFVYARQHNSYSHFDTAHKILGLLLGILVILQVVVAGFRPHPSKGSEPTPKIRRAWEIGHHLVGYLMILFGIITCFLGITDELPKLSNEGTKTGFLACACVALVAIIIVFGKIVLEKTKTTPTYSKARGNALPAENANSGEPRSATGVNLESSGEAVQIQ